ncbi:hypothetical protein [Streptomyces collinus]|uniref:hypothetical protein n=1 Tax=Streptomyces collinus TaxID=42684 RepID=UPI00340DA8A4
MTGGELTLGAVLAQPEEREREIAAQVETMRQQITQLTAQLNELGRTADEVRATHKTLLALPDPPPALKLPDHPAYQQIMAVFTAADASPAGRRRDRADGLAAATVRPAARRHARVHGPASGPGRLRLAARIPPREHGDEAF